MVTRKWKVYGADGHRQRLSFGESFTLDISKSPVWTRNVVIDCQCEDKTGTNEYVIFSITADSAEECQRELDGQLSDGFFENIRYGAVIEI